MDPHTQVHTGIPGQSALAYEAWAAALAALLLKLFELESRRTASLETV